MKEALNKYYLNIINLELEGRYNGCFGVPLKFLPKHLGLFTKSFNSLGSSVELPHA